MTYDTRMLIANVFVIVSFIFLAVRTFPWGNPEIHPNDRVIIKTEIISFTVNDTYTECPVKEVSTTCLNVEYHDTTLMAPRSTWVSRSSVTDVLPAATRPLSAEMEHRK